MGEMGGQHWKNFRQNSKSTATRLLGEGWTLFVTDSINTQYYQDVLNTGGQGHSQNIFKIRMKGGITPPNTINVYLVNALPYFEFPKPISKERLTIYLNIDNTSQNEGKGFSSIINENKLVIDIRNVNSNSALSVPVDITIEYQTNPNDRRSIVTLTESFYIYDQSIQYDFHNLFIYNGFGESIENAQDPYIQGCIVRGIESQELPQQERFYIQNTSDVDSSDNRYYLVNLLAACCYMNADKVINESLFKKCVRYAANRASIHFMEDYPYSKIRSLLVKSGYLSVQYGTPNKYQAIPPTFVKTPRSLDTINQIYMLTGCYTKKFLCDLIDFCKQHNVSIKYLNNSQEENLRSLLPPTILIGHNFNCSEFINQKEHTCTSQDSDVALNLLSVTKSIADYAQTLKDIPSEIFNATLADPYQQSFPRIRQDNNPIYNRHYYIEKRVGQFQKTTIKERAWMDLFCRWSQQQPMIIIDDNHIYLPDDLWLPYLVQRALHLMNLDFPEFKKAYIVDNNITDPTKNPLYSLMKVYNIGQNEGRREQLLEKLTGTSSLENNKLIRKKTQINRDTKIELWKHKDDFPDKEAKYMDILKQGGDNTAVLIRGRKSEEKQTHIYLNKNGSFIEVQDNAHAIWDHIIKKPNWEYRDFQFTDRHFCLPNRENYDIEHILIL